MTKLSKLATVALLFSAGCLRQAAGNNPLKDLPDASVVGEEQVREWARSLGPFGETQWSGERMPSPEHWGDFSMYQIFIDRFNNGDGSNDFVNVEPFQQDEMNRKSYENVHLYHHGGDLRGITNRLDYIKSLGTDIIFITSFLYNSEGQFHGYCVSNHLEVDPGFGNLEEFQNLVKEAHRRGMYIIMDFVVNHVCDYKTKYDGYYPSGQEHTKCAEGLYDAVENNRDDSNVPHRGRLAFSEDFFPPLKRQEYFSRCGRGLTENLGEAKYSDFVSWMWDLQTAHSQVHVLFAEMAKYWIAAADVDGFRLDATKHISDSFVPYFNAHVRDYATKLGKDNFYIIGEIVAGPEWQIRQVGTMNTPTLTPRTRDVVQQTRSLWSAHKKQSYPGFTAVYDFAHGGTTRSVARGENSPFSLPNVLGESSRQPMLQNSDDSQFWNLVDQHDWPRLLAGSQSIRDNQGVVLAAYSYTFTARGIPHIYYGTEHGFNGDCWWSAMDLGTPVATDRIQRHCSGDKSIGVPPFETHGDPDALYRQTMWVNGGYSLGMADRQRASGLVAIHEPRGANPHNWMSDPFLVDNDITKRVKVLNDIRKSCPALRRGMQYFREVNQEGLLTYSRIFYSQEIVVVVNTRGQELGVPPLYIDPGIASRAPTNRFRNLMDRNDVATASGGGDQFRLNVNRRIPAYGVAVYVREDFVDFAEPTPSPTFPPSITTAAPTSGSAPTPQPTSGDIVTPAPTSTQETLAPVPRPTEPPVQPPTPPTGPCEKDAARRRLQREMDHLRCLVNADVGQPPATQQTKGQNSPVSPQSTSPAVAAVVGGVSGATAFLALSLGMMMYRRRSRAQKQTEVDAVCQAERGAVVSANPAYGRE